MAETLSNDLILFAFINIRNQDRQGFRKLLLHIDNVNDLIKYQKEFLEFYNDLPTKKEARGFSTETNITYYDTRYQTEEERIKQRVFPHDGGDKQIIRDCLSKKNWMLEMLKEHIEKILNSPSNLSDFGQWNDPEDYSYFILKHKSILGCLSIYFNNLDKRDYPRYEDIYEKLVKVLYQPTGKPYSISTFKKTKERNTNNLDKKMKCDRDNYSKENCLRFLNYILQIKIT